MTKKMDERFRVLHEKLDAQHAEQLAALKPASDADSLEATKTYVDETLRQLADELRNGVKPLKKPVKKVAKKAAPVKKAAKR
jgi:hypothetical protein